MAQVAAWTVTNVVPTGVTNKQGQLVQGYQIDVRVADGHTFNVKVPASEYNPDTVKQMIDDVFQNYIAIKMLEGDQMDVPD